MNVETNQLELNVLRSFFEKVSAEQPINNTISDSKIIRDTKNQLKIALRNAEQRCSCAKRYYDTCEVCQATKGDLVPLRNFFRVIRKAKKHSLTAKELQEFVENTRKDLTFTK